jgi:hypothetical protein
LTKEYVRVPRFEPRWPVVLAILSVLGVLTFLPGRLKLVPDWVPYATGIVVLTPIAAVWLTSAKPVWLHVERVIIRIFFVVATVAILATLANLVDAMLERSKEVSGLELLASSIAVWVTNVLIFSLLYWQIDRGGPEARASQTGPRPDWVFPQESVPGDDVPPGWLPKFVDYFFLGFSTSTAFSTTETVPLTPRAKLLMMLESSISLLTIVLVAARAINVLGS